MRHKFGQGPYQFRKVLALAERTGSSSRHLRVVLPGAGGGYARGRAVHERREWGGGGVIPFSLVGCFGFCVMLTRLGKLISGLNRPELAQSGCS